MSNQVCPAILTRIDVYETLCPQQMLVHKGSQLNNVQLITGVERCHTYKIAMPKYSKSTAGILQKIIIKKKKKKKNEKKKKKKLGGVGG